MYGGPTKTKNKALIENTSKQWSRSQVLGSYGRK